MSEEIKMTGAEETADGKKTGSENNSEKKLDKLEKKSIEEMLDDVDEIIESLENGDIPLEDSFRIYEKGMKMVQTINQRIDKVEKKIIKLETGEENEA